MSLAWKRTATSPAGVFSLLIPNSAALSSPPHICRLSPLSPYLYSQKTTPPWLRNAATREKRVWLHTERVPKSVAQDPPHRRRGQTRRLIIEPIVADDVYATQYDQPTALVIQNLEPEISEAVSQALGTQTVFEIIELEPENTINSEHGGNVKSTSLAESGYLLEYSALVRACKRTNYAATTAMLALFGHRRPQTRS
ncbi:uncharacterized protein TRAVEDRAFT_49832 [Trametes versicolor FP-101664 SS1]|uniref:uncharacterized protein n=1 Tax=Trametes versicolor (strain FP-101664) TaxID=717944 RepID=UPI00046221E0|nr:uncharacterized protein TRAVEDRAFT_49832 [Trametes versicolor FP-101664 SS1]EIW57021.1 hypothetical protein TRAVEDRAFT_49832 [Trametes versicolor FP-101664 SS1]